MNGELEKILIKAKKASREMLLVSSEQKNQALKEISKALKNNINVILEENHKDMENAETNHMSEAMKDRLLLTEKRIESIADDVLKLVDLNDPIGEVIRDIVRPNGLHIQQVRVPIGVFGINSFILANISNLNFASPLNLYAPWLVPIAIAKESQPVLLTNSYA